VARQSFANDIWMPPTRKLLSLFQEGAAAYTETAWPLLQEELARRHAEPSVENTHAVLPLGRWGEVLNVAERVEDFVRLSGLHQGRRIRDFKRAWVSAWGRI